MKSILRILIIVIVIGALLAGGYWLYQDRMMTDVTATTDDYTQIVAVQQGDIDASISVVGELDAVQKADLVFDRMDGTTHLLSLEVEPGHEVPAGQVLATIDPASYQQVFDQAESALVKAEQLLEELQIPATELDLAQADLAIAEAQLELALARVDLEDLEAPDLTSLERSVLDTQESLQLAQLQQTQVEHASLASSERDLLYAIDWYQRHIWEMKDLVARGEANLEQQEELVEEQETLAELQADLARVQAQRTLTLQAATADVATTRTALTDAREALADAQAGGDEITLAQAQLAIHEAEVALATAQEDRADLEIGSDPVDLAAAQADVDKKKLALDEAQADLEATTLVAPFAGTILQTNAEAGDRINSNSIILSLANMDDLQVVAAIDETTIRQVAASQPTRISFDAFPEQNFSGQVESVPLQGTLQGGVMVYDVPISLQGAEALPLLVGMTANVDILVGQAENVLLIPTMALQTMNGFNQVLVANSADQEAEPEAVPVEAGLSDGVYTEIVRGLNLGDQVVVQFSAAESNNFGFRGMGAMGGFGAPRR